jgi:hypothetical protein
VAVSFSEQTATAATFTVPDRNGDSLPETIRYAWAGAGSPITRQVNGLPVPAAVIADNVQSFNLQYFTKTVQPPPTVESPEQLLISYDNVGSTSNFGIKNNTWAAEYFKPLLPGNALSWKVTRVKVQLWKVTAGVPYTIELFQVDSNQKPTGSSFAAVTFNTNTLATTPTWVEAQFPSPVSLDPTMGYAVVVKQVKQAATAFNVRYNSAATAYSIRAWTQTTNAGSGWSTPVNGTAMQFYVYGTVTTPGQ